MADASGVAGGGGERDYVLGTNDDELTRLGLQHRVWRARSLDAWRRAGFTVGQTLLDVGAGPGYAAVDLAEIVGPGGRVLAFDRSQRYLDALAATARARGLGQLRPVEVDLEVGDLAAAAAAAGGLPPGGAHGAWSRWVTCFLRNPGALLERVRELLEPGAPIVLHEYFHYTTWRLWPRSPEHEEFVRAVMASWRESGGEPEIGAELPGLLEAAGFRVESLRTHIDVVTPADYAWEWPKAFVGTGLARLVELGHVTPDRARAILAAFAVAEARPGTRMVTPAVLEVIARCRASPPRAPGRVPVSTAGGGTLTDVPSLDDGSALIDHMDGAG